MVDSAGFVDNDTRDRRLADLLAIPENKVIIF